MALCPPGIRRSRPRYEPATQQEGGYSDETGATSVERSQGEVGPHASVENIGDAALQHLRSLGPAQPRPQDHDHPRPERPRKTTLLRMVKSLCSGRYADLKAVPFGELRLDFDNGASISVRKTPEETSDQKESRKKPQLIIRYFESGKEKEQYKPPSRVDSHVMPEAIDWLDHRVPGLDRIGSGRWRYIPTRELLSTDAVLDRFGELLPPGSPPCRSMPPTGCRRSARA